MGFHFPRIATIFWLLLLLDSATAVSQTISASSYNPNSSVWTVTNGQYVSSQSGEGAYLDFIFNNNGEGYTAVSIDAYGYTGNPTSPTPASYTIQVNSLNTVYGAGQQQPVVLNNLVPTYTYRILIWASSSATGVIINSVVASRADSPTSSTLTHPTTSSLPPSSVAVASPIQASSLAASSLSPSSLSSFVTSAGAGTGTSTGTGNATSTERQTLGVPILLTVSGSVITQESQPTTLSSSSSSISSRLLLGVVIGPVAGAIVIMILAFTIYLRRRQQSRQKREQDEVIPYVGEEEAQQPPTIGEPNMVEQSDAAERQSTIAEKSRYLYQSSDRARSDRGGRTPSRHTASATAHVSYITSVSGSSLGGRAYGGIEGPNSDPLTSNSRISMSSIENQTVAPPAYVEEESNVSLRTGR